MTLTARASLRYLAHHRAQCLLAIAGIALGVAIVIGIQATQQAARASFAASLHGVFGSATHTVSAATGSFDEALLASARRRAPGLGASPVVAGALRVGAGETSTSVRLVGIDPLSASLTRDGVALPLERFMLEPDAAILGARMAARLGVAAGTRLDVVTAAGASTLTVLAVLADRGRASEVADAVVVDIATAQELLGLAGRLTAIELDAGGETAVSAARSTPAAAA
ncbi:MAG: ABC transporter permease, partial [Gammaproteobacteria bacterium]